MILNNQIGFTQDSGLKQLFLNELRDLYWTEKALVETLPKLAKNASCEKLAVAMDYHYYETLKHVDRLEQVFESLCVSAYTKKCDAMSGLIDEAEWLICQTEEGAVRDAGIISTAHKIEHYEIASYGTLISFANSLGETDAAGILEETLMEERDADNILSGIAITSLQLLAASA